MRKKLNCVLLVDDNESDNFIHKRVLEKADIASHIETSINGKEALDFLIANGKNGNTEGGLPLPDLIFLDINMPVMDGWEFLEEFEKLQDSQKGKAVFIMLTTSLNPADKYKAEMIIGDDCFQYKPLTMKMINDVMQRHFPDYL